MTIEELIALLKSDDATLETVQPVLERVLFHAAEFFDDRDDDIAVAALLLAKNVVGDQRNAKSILGHSETIADLIGAKLRSRNKDAAGE